METWEKVIQGAYICWLLFIAVAIVVEETTFTLISLVIFILLSLVMEGEIFLHFQRLTKPITPFYYIGGAILNFFGLVGLAGILMLGVPTEVTGVVYIGLLLGSVLSVHRVLLLIKQFRIERRSY